MGNLLAAYKDKKQIQRPKEDWVIFENTHEAIVDQDTWDMAQKCRTVKRRTDTLGAANPLTGLLYCADCGRRMYNHRNMSAYLRKTAANGYIINLDLPELNECFKLLRSASNNLNQIARRVNSGGGAYPDEVAAVQSCLDENRALFGKILDGLAKIK